MMILGATTPLFSEPDSSQISLEDQWDAILEDHVFPGQIGDYQINLVDYRAIRADERWEVLLETLANQPEPDELAEKLAFWSNAYNILAIDVVVKNYPVRSIRQVGGLLRSVWKIDAGVVAGESRSLDEIEHTILRSLGDARIHAAIVCASISCPPLRKEAFRAEKLDTQFDEQMRVWLADSFIGASYDEASNQLSISKIFDWFSEDFETEKGSVLNYIKPYLPEEIRDQVNDETRVRFLDYNWNLNDLASGARLP